MKLLQTLQNTKAAAGSESPQLRPADVHELTGILHQYRQHTWAHLCCITGDVSYFSLQSESNQLASGPSLEIWMSEQVLKGQFDELRRSD